MHIVVMAHVRAAQACKSAVERADTVNRLRDALAVAEEEMDEAVAEAERLVRDAVALRKIHDGECRL